MQIDVSIIACTADAERTSNVEQYYAAVRGAPSYQQAGPINHGNSTAAIATGEVKTMACHFVYDNAVAKTMSGLVGWQRQTANLLVQVCGCGFIMCMYGLNTNLRVYVIHQFNSYV